MFVCALVDECFECSGPSHSGQWPAEHSCPPSKLDCIALPNTIMAISRSQSSIRFWFEKKKSILSFHSVVEESSGGEWVRLLNCQAL